MVLRRQSFRTLHDRFDTHGVKASERMDLGFCSLDSPISAHLQTGETKKTTSYHVCVQHVTVSVCVCSATKKRNRSVSLSAACEVGDDGHHQFQQQAATHEL